MDLSVSSDRSAWRRVGFFELVDKPVGFCAYAPAAVIHDLFRIACPGRRALHARAASEVEKNELAAALQRRYGTQASSHMTIARPCVSRLDPNWASATIAATGNVDSANIWFQRKTGRWAVAYSPPYAKRGRPSDAIILSLASCVGYSASV